MFNFDTKQCESCQEGRKFSVNSHRCVNPEAATEFQTNPISTPYLIYDGVPGIQYQRVYN